MKKLMIASDIHGCADCCARLLQRFDQEGADRLLLLGDILYHGPRNALPAGYAPQKVSELLNARKDILLCVRGNCDAEVDQMVLEFPILADYCVISMEHCTLFATHGHTYGEDSPPPLPASSVLLGGHTHVPTCHPYDNYTYLNPGSTTIPKENSPRSYMTVEDGVFLWKELDTGSEYRRWTVF